MGAFDQRGRTVGGQHNRWPWYDPVDYKNPYREPTPDFSGKRPYFCIRGWDDGKVYVDVYCLCGRILFDKETPLSDTGVVSVLCGACGHVYSVSVSASVSA